MADFSISMTVPDDKVADLTSALRSYYGKKDDGTDYSIAELKVLFSADVRKRLTSHYRDWMTRQAAQPDLGVT